MTAWCQQSLIARPCDVFDFRIMYFDLNSPYALLPDVLYSVHT